MGTTTMLAALTFPQLDPVLFQLGPLAVRWYGLAYVAGVLSGYAILLGMIRRGVLRITAAALGDLVSWLVVGILVGGRLGWWLVYDRAGGDQPWWEPFAIWHGGMSFHGGLVGVAVALTVWSRWRRQPFWNIADGLALVAPIGLFFGRIANFINAELVGRTTTVPWGVIFPGDTVPRHPSQLYEAILEGPVLLALVWFARRWVRHNGQLAALFLIGYGLLRFAVEFTRQPDAEVGFIAFGWLTMGQLLSVALGLAGVVLFVALSLAGGTSSTPREELPVVSKAEP